MSISKELLREVLGLTNSGVIDEIYQEDNLLYFCQLNKGINIYELVYKCKEWALKSGYQLHSAIRTESYPICILIYEQDGSRHYFKADTEPEVIFKACQWLLENKRKEDERSKY